MKIAISGSFLNKEWACDTHSSSALYYARWSELVQDYRVFVGIVCEIASNHDPSQNRNSSLIARGNAPSGWGHVSRER